MAQINLFRHHVRDADGVLVPHIKAIVIPTDDEDAFTLEDASVISEWLRSPTGHALILSGDHEVRWLA